MPIVIPYNDASGWRGTSTPIVAMRAVAWVTWVALVAFLWWNFGFTAYSKVISPYERSDSAVEGVSPALLARAKALNLQVLEVRPRGFSAIFSTPSGLVDGQTESLEVRVPAYKEARFTLDLSGPALQAYVYRKPQTAKELRNQQLLMSGTLRRAVEYLEQRALDEELLKSKE